jgi:hypothetical protein
MVAAQRQSAPSAAVTRIYIVTIVVMDRYRCSIRVRQARPPASVDIRTSLHTVPRRSHTRHGERAVTTCKRVRMRTNTYAPHRYSQSPHAPGLTARAYANAQLAYTVDTQPNTPLHGVFMSNGGRSSSRVVRNIRHRRATGSSALPPTAALPPLKRMPPAESPSAWLAMQHIKSVQQRLGSDLNVGDGMCVCARTRNRVQYRAARTIRPLAAARARRFCRPSRAIMPGVHRAYAQQ